MGDVPCYNARDPCRLCNTSFSILFSMTLVQSDGSQAVPPLALSLVKVRLEAVSILNGVQAWVTLGPQPKSTLSGLVYPITIKFPTRVYGQRYPATCLNQAPYIVDVSENSTYCSTFADNLGDQLVSGEALYESILTALSGFVGAPLQSLVFSPPTCYL